MSKTVSIDQLADEIVNSVQDYTEPVKDAIEKETRSTARKMKREIKSNSPKETGEYANGWSYSTSKKYGKIVITVYNKDKPQLTHLLENGHAIDGGTGRVEGIPHIGPAEKKYIAEYQKNINKILENGG
jgi:hypothetical protein